MPTRPFEGFSLELTESGGWLEPGQGLVSSDRSQRSVSDLEPVLPPGHHLSPSLVVYRMYRGVARPQDQAIFEEKGIRYDITAFIPSWDIPEAVKTFGHDHPAAPDTLLTYPEVYQVIVGRAFFLLQSEKEAALIPAAPGDIVWIPPHFGHVTVNPGPSGLLIANLVASDFESIYEGFSQRGGAGYRLVSGQGDGGIRAVPNPKYRPSPPITRAWPGNWNRQRGPRPQASRLQERSCMYQQFVSEPSALDCLTRPQKAWA